MSQTMKPNAKNVEKVAASTPQEAPTDLNPGEATGGAKMEIPEKVARGLRDLHAGRVVSHEDAEARLARFADQSAQLGHTVPFEQLRPGMEFLFGEGDPGITIVKVLSKDETRDGEGSVSFRPKDGRYDTVIAGWEWDFDHVEPQPGPTKGRAIDHIPAGFTDRATSPADEYYPAGVSDKTPVAVVINGYLYEGQAQSFGWTKEPHSPSVPGLNPVSAAITHYRVHNHARWPYTLHKLPKEGEAILAPIQHPETLFDKSFNALVKANADFAAGLSSSLDHSRTREAALSSAVKGMADEYGVTLRQPIQIDANGEFSLVIEPYPQQPGYGESFAALLNKHNPRTGIQPGAHLLPENAWCRMNHFDVERLVLEHRDQQMQDSHLCLPTVAKTLKFITQPGQDGPSIEKEGTTLPVRPCTIENNGRQWACGLVEWRPEAPDADEDAHMPAARVRNQMHFWFTALKNQPHRGDVLIIPPVENESGAWEIGIAFPLEEARTPAYRNRRLAELIKCEQ